LFVAFLVADAPTLRVGAIRLSMKPGQVLQLDGAQRQSMGLLCEADALILAITAPAELILPGATGRK